MIRFRVIDKVALGFRVRVKFRVRIRVQAWSGGPVCFAVT